MSDLIAKNRFNITKIMDMKGYDSFTEINGNQVLNFFNRNNNYKNNPQSQAFVKKYLSQAKCFGIDAQVMKYASDQITLDGFILEMGVCTGRTINFIAALNSEKVIYGFDSFEGMPEEWNRGDDLPIPKGTFAFLDNKMLPLVLHNVQLIKGLFQDTLPKFLETILGNKPISFLHVDSDIYSSAKTIFKVLAKNIVEGSIILFDDFYNYPEFHEHEFKALQEFLSENNKKAEYLAFNENWEQVAVRIHDL